MESILQLEYYRIRKKKTITETMQNWIPSLMNMEEHQKHLNKTTELEMAEE